MKYRKLGVDLDGCLANFSDSYAKLITKHTGLVFPKSSDTWPAEWYWERVAGVTKEQERQIWQEDILQQGSDFWFQLEPLPEAVTTAVQLNHLSKSGHQVFFLTNRAGWNAKYQTERFLYEIGIDYPTVLLVVDKAPLIQVLQLDFFIDDRLETVNDLARIAEEENLPIRGHIWLKEAPYNRVGKRNDVKEAKTVIDALKQEGLW